MEKKSSISVIILTLNEAGNIKNVVSLVSKSLQEENLNDYELILVDSGSADGTEKIIEELALTNIRIKAVHDLPKGGLGHGFRTGVALASKDYVGWFPGDNETLPQTINNVFKEIGRFDIVIPYTVNPDVRSLYRRTLSVTYTTFFNIAFGLRLNYFNGPCFFRRTLLDEIVMSTNGPAYMAEILVQLIKKGVSYVEVPMYIKPREYGKTSVLKWKNVYLIAETVVRLFFRLRLSRNKKPNRQGEACACGNQKS